jgi:tRNA 2-thiouridine synthesizing protein A
MRQRCSIASPTPADDAWDAGDLGCGELVLELKVRLDRMEPGQLMKLVALDPGAPADLPAWCRMTGHTLVSSEHPVYLIRRKES